MNKKFLMFGIPLLAIALVSAVAYYGFFSATFTVTPAISIDGLEDFEVPSGTIGGETIPGSEITLTNDAPSERTITITDDSEGTGVEVSYMGSLTMVEKDISTWEVIEGGDSETITYTVVGEDFVVNEISEGYTLIYYPNTEGDVFATNVANVIVLTEGVNDITNLPIALDFGDDYCNNGFNPDTTQCVGAKLWLIEGTELEALAKLNVWDTTGFLFETELIQYNAEGNIVMSPGSSLTIIPEYTPSSYGGTYTIETTIA